MNVHLTATFQDCS